MKNNLELLAPAGSLDNLKVAVSAGADAVYLGLQTFNARNKADNFSKENIAEVVAYCHLRNVKVYLTVNTLIKDSEVQDFIDMIKVCVEAKVDAYIVQDFGVAYLLKNNFANICLHSSTQMGVHNLEGAKVMEKYGFTRVVLSRETTLEDIRQIRQNTSLEIEYFVQGALCVAFSGNCYMSSLMHNESGNRGRCLQLCRLPYSSFIDDKPIKKGYLLSPTDISLIDRLKELKKAGVDSLKIEGRMRRSGYVATATKEYRKAIDNLEGKDFNKDNLVKVFYRGKYNEAYLDTKNPNIINTLFQNHRGVEIGVVKAVKPFKNLNEIIVSSAHNIVVGDGLKFVGRAESSLGVGSVKKVGDNYSLISTAKPNKDDKVFLMVDKAYEDSVVSIDKKIDITAKFVGKVGNKPILTFVCGEVEVSCSGENVLEKAKSSPMTIDMIGEQIAKLGDTDFNLVSFEADIEDIFMPKSQLNELRRNAIEQLKVAIIEEYNLNNIRMVSYQEQKEPQVVDEPISLTIVNELSDIKGIVTDVVISPLDYNDIEKVQAIKSKCPKKVYLNLPIVLNSKDKVVLDNLLSKVAFDGVVANNIYGLAVKAKEIIAGTGLNITNRYAVKFFNEQNITKHICSIEKYLVDGGTNFYSGRPALMTLVHCPYKVNLGGDCKNCKYTQNLTYTQGQKKFIIRRYRLSNCYFEVLPSESIGKGSIIDIR